MVDITVYSAIRSGRSTCTALRIILFDRCGSHGIGVTACGVLSRGLKRAAIECDAAWNPKRWFAARAFLQRCFPVRRACSALAKPRREPRTIPTRFDGDRTE